MEKIDLNEFGLTPVESRIYLELVKLGSTKAGPLIQKADMHRATVYDALKRLVKKGLVSYVVKEKTKYFMAAHPGYLLDIIEEEKKSLAIKENHAKEAIRELEAIQERAKTAQFACVYQGKRGVRTVFEDILNYSRICSLASKGRFGEVLGNYFGQFQNKKRRRKIKDRVLISGALRDSKYVKSIYGEIRFLPAGYDYPAATIVYGNKVAMFVFTEDPVVFVVDSREIADSYRAYFEMLWNKSSS